MKKEDRRAYAYRIFSEYEELRDNFTLLQDCIERRVIDGRVKSLITTKIDEGMLWLKVAIDHELII